MNNLNYCLFEGYLIKDPDTRYTNTGAACVNFSLAVNKSYKKDGEWINQVSFFDFVAWGKTGENCANYLKKGSPVRVVCEAKQDRWEQDGKVRTKVSFTVKEVTFLPKKKDNQENTVPGTENNPTVSQGSGVSYNPDDFEEEIPF